MLASQQAYLRAQNAAEQTDAAYGESRRAFFDAQAGILARELAEGVPCPVCGSVHHPAPAHAPGRAPTEEQLREAEQARDAAQQRAHAKSLDAGAKNAAFTEKKQQLIAQMQPFAEQPAYENAEAQLGVCEEKARQEGADAARQLSALEAQHAAREALGHSMETQQKALERLAAEQEEQRSAASAAENLLSRLRGQQEQLAERLSRQLAEALPGCRMENAAACIAAERRIRIRECGGQHERQVHAADGKRFAQQTLFGEHIECGGQRRAADDVRREDDLVLGGDVPQQLCKVCAERVHIHAVEQAGRADVLAVAACHHAERVVQTRRKGSVAD